MHNFESPFNFQRDESTATTGWEQLADNPEKEKKEKKIAFDLREETVQKTLTMEPIKQLHFLQKLPDAPFFALEENEKDFLPVYKRITDIYSTFASNEHASPLVKIFAETLKKRDTNNLVQHTRINQNLKTIQDAEVYCKNMEPFTGVIWDDYVDDDSEPDPFWDRDEYLIESEDYLSDVDDETYFNNVRDQEIMRNQEFPTLSENHPIHRIAKDAAATLLPEGHPNRERIVDITRKDGEETDPDTTFLLQTLHGGEMESIVQNKLGIKLSETSLDSQIQLLKYMTTADDDRFYKLCTALNNQEPDMRLTLAESFLSADFGEDFGDALLDIAESDRFSPENVKDVLNTIESCRSSIESITSLFTHLNDREFQKDYARAANERLTDALAVFREIGENGNATADLGWAGNPNLTFEDALEALRYEAKSLENISGTVSDVMNNKEGSFAEKVLTPDEQRDRTLYNLYSKDHGYVLLYTRKEGSNTFDPMLEYGKRRSKYNINATNSGVEASISFITNPVDPLSLPNPFRPNVKAIRDPNYYDHSTMDKVSALRLDREGRAPNASADDPDRDPINPIGTISVDLAAINDREDTPSGKIARLFSVGNKLRENSVGTAFSLNHNTHYFDQDKYGTSDGFKNLVNHLDSQVSLWCNTHPPKPGDVSFTGAMKTSSRRRTA